MAAPFGAAICYFGWNRFIFNELSLKLTGFSM